MSSCVHRLWLPRPTAYGQNYRYQCKGVGRVWVPGMSVTPLCKPFFTSIKARCRGRHDNVVSTLCLTQCDSPLKSPGYVLAMCAMSSNFVDETLSVREFMKYGVKMSTFCVLNILKIQLFMGRFIHSFHF